MWKRKFSNVLLIFFLLGAATQLVLGDDDLTIDDYCEKEAEMLPCSTKCALGDDCGDASDNEWEEMPQDFRDTMLKEHNTIRNSVAKGDLEPAAAAPERRRRDEPPPDAAAAPAGPEYAKKFPKASGMRALSYSKELEFLALCHARSCKDESASAIMQDGSEVGLNVYIETGDAVAEGDEPAADPADLLKNVIPAWMGQATALTDNLGAFAAADEAKVGYLTQLLWCNTTKVGCGKVHYVADEKNHWVVACAYSPKGNEDGKNVYEVGDIACEDKNTEYANLCGPIEAMEDFTFPALPGGALKVAAAWSTITYFVWYFALALF